MLRAAKEQKIILHCCVLLVISINYIWMHGTMNIKHVYVCVILMLKNFHARPLAGKFTPNTRCAIFSNSLPLPPPFLPVLDCITEVLL
jgi:hypothetical protein